MGRIKPTNFSVLLLLIWFFLSIPVSASDVVTVDYSPAIKASGAGTCSAKYPANGILATSFRHQLSSDCYSCPIGFERSLNPNINANDACVRLITASSDFSSATYKGKRNVSKPSASTKGGNVFFDPRKGGEWWECPGNRPRRTLYAVTDSKACATKEIIGEKLSKAKFRSKKTRPKPSGAFVDPRNGGEYWSCPSGYDRTIFPVTDKKACEKVTPARTETAKAQKRGTRGCPPGAFQNGLRPECYKCPAEFKRSLEIGDDLSKEPKACVRVIVDPSGQDNSEFIEFAKAEIERLEGIIRPTTTVIGTHIKRQPDLISAFLEADTNAERERVASQIAAPLVQHFHSVNSSSRSSTASGPTTPTQPSGASTPLSLTNGWKGFGGASIAPTYRKSGNTISFSGMIRGGNPGLIAQLPLGYRPGKIESFNISSQGLSSKVNVYPNGNIELESSRKKRGPLGLPSLNLGSINLSSISYKIEDFSSTDQVARNDGSRDDDTSNCGSDLDSKALSVAIVTDASFVVGTTYTPIMFSWPTCDMPDRFDFKKHNEPYQAIAGSAGITGGIDASIEIGIWFDKYEELDGKAFGVVGGASYAAGYAMTVWWSNEEEPRLIGYTITPQSGVGAELEFTIGETFKHPQY